MSQRKQLSQKKAAQQFSRAQHVNPRNYAHLDRIKRPEMYRGGIRL